MKINKNSRLAVLWGALEKFTSLRKKRAKKVVKSKIIKLKEFGKKDNDAESAFELFLLLIQRFKDC